MNTSLVIDPEFEALCPPLTDEEYEQLEENVVSEGEVLMPLIVWDGIIIDGHNRYKIAQAYPAVKYSIRDKQFSNRYEAISWICKNQLGRRNLTDVQKAALIGRRYEAEKMAYGAQDGFRGNQYVELVNPQNEDLPKADGRTAQRIAKELGVSRATVERAGQFVNGLDAAEQAVPGVGKEILSGKIKPSKQEVAAVAKAPLEARREAVEEWRKPKDDTSTRTGPASARKELNEVREVYAGMLEADDPVSEDYVLETLHGAVTDMIRVCDTLFADFPRLLEDREYKSKVIEIMQEPKTYILQIEGEKQ